MLLALLDAPRKLREATVLMRLAQQPICTVCGDVILEHGFLATCPNFNGVPWDAPNGYLTMKKNSNLGAVEYLAYDAYKQGVELGELNI